MRYHFILSIGFLAGFLQVAGAQELSLSLTYLYRANIKHKAQGLEEPSGVVVSKDGTLWTVSDDTKRIFALTPSGKLRKEYSFKIDVKDLEGLAFRYKDNVLLAVQEGSNEILEISLGDEEVVGQAALASMSGYESIAAWFEDDDDANKGLEGITWNPDTETIFILKEGKPGLLIEVARDLKTIESHIVLNEKAGFADDDTSGKKIDFSGVCYDPAHAGFWIVSDKARRAYFFDAQEKQVKQSFALGYEKDGEYREIEKAEGVALSPDGSQLYIVSDEEARLYVFQVK